MMVSKAVAGEQNVGREGGRVVPTEEREGVTKLKDDDEDGEEEGKEESSLSYDGETKREGPSVENVFHSNTVRLGRAKNVKCG